jgi:uncharacterized protein (DUF488 family)
MTRLATIGYEGATMSDFLAALKDEGVALLVDVRAVASSRRPGFSKTKLAANLAEAGIEYLHLRGLGTPADGRAAARAGKHADMRAVYAAHLETPVAQADFATLRSILEGPRRACLMCFEADYKHCHRSLIVDALAKVMKVEAVHLVPVADQ